MKLFKDFLIIFLLPLIALVLFIFSFCNIGYSASATLSWNPNSEEDLGGYKVYYGKSSRSYDTSVNVGNVLSWTIDTLIPGEHYFFAATAYDNNTPVPNESGYSNEVDYEVPLPDTMSPILVLLGPDVITVEKGSVYTEPGATATDNVDGDLTDSIVITDDIDINTVGVYTVTYQVSDQAGNNSVKFRTVNVSDTTAPSTPDGIQLSPLVANLMLWNESPGDIAAYNVIKNRKSVALVGIPESKIYAKNPNKPNETAHYQIQNLYRNGTKSKKSNKFRVKFHYGIASES